MIKSNHKGFAGNLLFALNIFIVVLLLAGEHLLIPRWLQPVGRLHPLILHFPIVLLMLAMLMEFFRFRADFAAEKIYQQFTTVILLSGALLAAVTAIMGLFLAREAGYDSGSVQWHKWFGVSIVFIASVIYWIRDKSWYKQPAARSGSLIMVILLLYAGHYGANITHGENFIFGPILTNTKPPVPIDQALVYRDVIQPIFEKKCISCHNADKLKGGLMLIDEQSVLKGGKTGKLFVPGQPQVSLLLQRIHLPEEEKKHMPPSGKIQLTAAEMNVFYQWIKENADFKKKLVDLPASDSLRLAASVFLKPAAEAEEQYDFSAANEKEIKKLNNNYRVIYSLAEGSPALAVNIYNKASYNPKVLDELSAIKKQVISLNLNKMPVKDAELKTIATFVNLRTLNLNFSDITGNTLKDLAPLKHLRSLSLSGTKLNAQSLGQLNSINSLKELVLWNTGLSPLQLNVFQDAHKNIALIRGFKDDGKPMKLVPPQVKNTVFVISKPVELVLTNPIKGVDIRYTTDGTDPDSTKSPLYKPGIMVSNNTTIRARAFKPGWYGSDMVGFSFYKNAFPPDSISLIKAVSERYPAFGAKTLTDGELGGNNFTNNKWLGTQTELAVMLYFKNPVKPHTLTLNCLRVMSRQIFLPAKVQVWGGTDPRYLKIIGSLTTEPQKKTDKDLVQGLDCKLTEERAVTYIKIVAEPIKKSPAPNPKKVEPPWLFTDEVFIN